MFMKNTFFALSLATVLIFTVSAMAKETASKQQIVFTNVNIFDGENNKLAEDMNVLVEGNLIKEITTGEVAVNTKNTMVIDGGGRTLMPGLIDSHVHINMYKEGTYLTLQDTTWEEIGARAVAMVQEMLAMGFTTLRDTCGAHSGLKRVIDEGILSGPRLYVSGACISQTSGHGDFSLITQRKGESILERLDMTRIVDGRDEVLAAGRRNFSLGAHFLKLMAGGGVTSVKDPVNSSQFSDDELRAGVEVAEDRGSYVTVHAFRDEDIDRSLDLGVKVIEHGYFISEKTMKKLVANDRFLSPNIVPFTDEVLGPSVQKPYSLLMKKLMYTREKSADYINLIRRFKPKVVFNSDFALSTGMSYRHSIDFAKFLMAKEFGNFQALKAMTSTGGELAALTGSENPYQDGKLGVIEEGAYADILIVDGNPLKDITAIGGNSMWRDAKPRDQNTPTIRVIMKDGKIYKNTL